MGRQLAFDEGFRKGFADAHHLAGRLHLRAKNGIDPREFVERENGFLDRKIRGDHLMHDALFGQRSARHATRGNLGQRQPRCLGNERHGTRSARVDFEHINRFALNGELDVHQSAYIQPLGHQLGLTAQLILDFRRQ